jgi:aspartyl-tRNA(Asn)/glutamyl-tRNA(Gln) amidotransferase subunit C
MPIDGAEVRRIARLARLDLGDGEVQTLGRELGSILRHVAMLDGLETNALAPTTAGGDAPPVLRDDLPRPSLSPADALAGAPEADTEFFRVPRVLGD